MPTWTTQQLRCLEALNIPVMAFVPPSRSATSTRQVIEADTAPIFEAAQEASGAATTVNNIGTATEQDTTATYFYRLGPWFFQSSTQLPVTGVQWINDLAAYADTRLSQTSNVGDALNIDAYLQEPLTAEQKRELWNILKAHLNK